MCVSLRSSKQIKRAFQFRLTADFTCGMARDVASVAFHMIHFDVNRFTEAH